jgi:hypothetical protein
MSKFEIKEVQIDFYNDTVEKLNKFDSGLNIICGENEAGKTTLMQFIENIFLREKSTAKGYIKCLSDGKNIKLYADKDKLKDNENYISEIFPHAFKTGFVINLDDLVRAKKGESDELVNTIKDSSGMAIKSKEAEYHDYIYGRKQKFNLTSTNKASNATEQQLDKLNQLHNTIVELQKEEEHYNLACVSLERKSEELKRYKNEYNYVKLLSEKLEVEGKKSNIKINEKLIESKKEFEKIRENYGALNLSEQNSKRFSDNVQNYKEKYDENFEKLNNIDDFDEDKISKFDLNSENLTISKTLQEDLMRKRSEFKRVEADISTYRNDISVLERELSNLKSDEKQLNISDINTYSDDKTLAEKYISNYSKLLDDLRKAEYNLQNSKPNKEFDHFNFFALLFSGIFFASLSGLLFHLHDSSKYMFIAMCLVAIVGVRRIFSNKPTQTPTQNDNYIKEIEQNKSMIVKTLSKYGFDYSDENDFVVKTNCYIDKMKEKISEYRNISNDISKVESTKDRKKVELDNLSKRYDELEKDLDITTKEISDFIEETKVSDIQNYSEIYFLVKTLQDLNTKIKEAEKEIDVADSLREQFVKMTNDYIVNCDIEIQTINKYEPERFEGVLKEIQGILEKDIANARLLKEIEEKTSFIEKEMEKYPQEMKENISGEDIDELEESLSDKIDEMTKETTLLQKEIHDLKQVESLVGLKNEKNIELNRVREGFNNLIVKEIVSEIIQASKEKFNEIQPNLVSAKQYLAHITNNKYTEIDFEEKNISGEDTKEKSWEILSRGTKEQLYLALRLGFASNYSKDREGNPNGLPNLPLIIDDAFVNFDTNRTKSVLKCLSEFSHTNQVLYFTCHSESIKEMLKDNSIQYNLIEITK